MRPGDKVDFSGRQELDLKRMAAPNDNFLFGQLTEVLKSLLFAPVIQQSAEDVPVISIEGHLLCLPPQKQKIFIGCRRLTVFYPFFVISKSYNQIMVGIP